jgi:protein phosphatase
MKIVVISDLHSNFDALEALPELGDELWVLGDLVNYGPMPSEVVSFVRSHSEIVIRGNHDNAVGFDADPRCTPRYAQMADTTMRYSKAYLDGDANSYLRSLPLTRLVERDGHRFYRSMDTVPKIQSNGRKNLSRWKRTSFWLGTLILRLSEKSGTRQF